ncbi:hypothetical protein FRC06_002256 [Ceratobasidium sp. 370]|nr:hypothetical protein FRC06_002256 [Ceratobasidium sp. 370]
MTVARLEWYESVDGTNNFLLFQLTSAARSKKLWVRLGRRSRRHSRYSRLRSVAGPVTSLVHQLAADDFAIVSCDREDLLVSWKGFTLKKMIDKPTPFSLLLDILDLAHKDLSSYANDSRVYASFVMNSIHQFNEPINVSADNKLSNTLEA